VKRDVIFNWGASLGVGIQVFLSVQGPHDGDFLNGLTASEVPIMP
jgi:hypothetical protein